MLILDIISIFLVMIILIVIIFYLISINKKLNERIKLEKYKESRFRIRYKELANKKEISVKDIEILSRLARDFFNDKFKLDSNLSYTELSKLFKKESIDERVKFCDLMESSLYSGEKIDSRDIKKLIEIFGDVLEKYD